MNRDGDRKGKERTMRRPLKCFLLVLCVLFVSPSLPYAAGPGESTPSGQEKVSFPTMAGPGRKVPVGDDHYLVYGFDKKPKLGTVIMKVEIFATKGDRKETSFEVRADAGMPSMKGAHETGERPFALSKKGDYLLPINIVMPGDWEVRLTILKEGKVVLRGSYQFGV
jgi:hypothetical protein